MQHIGVDIIEIARIEKAIARWGERFLQRIYTDSELKLYYKKPSSLAVRFASKEAVTLEQEGQALAGGRLRFSPIPVVDLGSIFMVGQKLRQKG
jgi:holo-[acyl-carrier protein] synthase